MFFERHGGGWQVFDESREGHRPVERPPPAHTPTWTTSSSASKSRKKPNADIEEGHRSTLLCQIGNISYRLGGRKLQFDGKNEKFVNDEEANAYLKRTYRDPYVVPETV